MPGIAVAEWIAQQYPSTQCVFLCSDKQLDADILQKTRGLRREPIPARPAAARPFPAAPMRFAFGWWRSVNRATCVLREARATSPEGIAVVSMGGYVAAPVLRAAKRLGLPSLMVNLDRVPGKANRLMCQWATRAVTAVPVDPDLSPARLRDAEVVGMPIRSSAMSRDTAEICRQRFGLDPDRPTLLITGASQGAGSLNDLLRLMCATPWSLDVLRSWQVLHLCGPGRAKGLDEAYRRGAVRSRVIEFCDSMGDAWGSATLALSRAGASSVAEAAANRVPTIFAPYPWHRDLHQRFNAAPLVDIGAAWCLEDQIHPEANLEGIGRHLIDLMASPDAIRQAKDSLDRSPPCDARARIAEISLELIGYRLDARQ